MVKSSVDVAGVAVVCGLTVQNNKVITSTIATLLAMLFVIGCSCRLFVDYSTSSANKQSKGIIYC